MKKLSVVQKISERDVLKSIIEYLNIKKILYIRNQTGALVVENRFVKFGSKGSPDIFVFLRGGVCVGIEAKSSTGKQSDDQKIWQQKFEGNGFTYILAKSVEDVAKVI